MNASPLACCLALVSLLSACQSATAPANKIFFTQVHQAIRDPGFEKQGQPATEDWNVQDSVNYRYRTNAVEKAGGRFSLMISSRRQRSNQFTSFSQMIVLPSSPRLKIMLAANIRTQALNGKAFVWCQALDKNGEIITAFNSRNVLAGTGGWMRIQLPVIIGPDTKKLRLGGSVAGSGIAWFDNFNFDAFEEIDTTLVSDSVQSFVQHTRTLIHQHSLFAGSLQWDELNAETDKMAKGIKNVSDAGFIAEYMIRRLRKAGDNHSFMQPAQAAADYQSNKKGFDHPAGFCKNGTTGYLRIPAFGGTGDSLCRSFATEIQELIRQLDQHHTIRGWIVDLRENNGGNMHPMIAGLGPLLGDGIAGYFISPKEPTRISWGYLNGKTGAVTVENPYWLKNKNTKIAVLVGRHTGSSGEMTALSFIGKKNVQLFGQTTAGYTTANTAFALAGGSYLYLASAYAADRTGKTWPHGIEPDFPLPPGNDSASDKTLEAAVQWLHK